LFEPFAALFERATSGDALLQFHSRDARRGLQAWTVALLDLLLASETCDMGWQDGQVNCHAVPIRPYWWPGRISNSMTRMMLPLRI
jgi:hypothetical protein